MEDLEETKDVQEPAVPDQDEPVPGPDSLLNERKAPIKRLAEVDEPPKEKIKKGEPVVLDWDELLHDLDLLLNERKALIERLAEVDELLKEKIEKGYLHGRS